MIMERFKVPGKKNVIIGTSNIVCHHCAAKYASENKKTLSEVFPEMRGKFTGKLLKIFPQLRDPNGYPAYLCEDCATEIAKELTPDD